mgnify:CR=1 FL=1
MGDEYGGGSGLDAVGIGSAATVAATDCWIWAFGSAFCAQAVTIKILSSSKVLYRMCRLYSFSEQTLQ